jgi:hypothetical protein
MNQSVVPSALRVRRAAVIGAAGLSGVLVLVSMVVDPAPEADGFDMVAGYASDLTASGLHTNLIHYGFALIAPVVFAMVALVRARGAWLANVAGVLAILGLTTLPGLVLLDFTSVATLLASDQETLAAVDKELEGMGWFVAIIAPAFIAAVLALPVAVAALWRAGLVPGFVPIAAVVTAVAMNVAPTWWLGFGINAVWMLVVAFFLARIPMSTWYGDRPVGGPVDTSEPALT